MLPTDLLQKPAPAFSAPDQGGKVHTSKEYRGKWLLLYFYPKDDTSGCTAEACGFRDRFGDLKKHMTIVGVSTDPVESHKKFAENYALPFTLLSDAEKKMVEAFGVWQQKTMYGRNYMGTVRTTFLINPEGNVVKVYEKVQAEEHANEIVKDMHEWMSS